MNQGRRVALALAAGAYFLLIPCRAGTQAQAGECLPAKKQVLSSMDDLQRVRVELEEQTKLLRDIRELLKRR